MIRDDKEYTKQINDLNWHNIFFIMQIWHALITFYNSVNFSTRFFYFFKIKNNLIFLKLNDNYSSFWISIF